MKQTIKQRQVATMIQREFSVVLQKEGSYLYGDALVTVTNVKMSADMGIAYIYLSVYNALYKQEVIKQMWENLPRLRGELGNRIRKQVRRIPMLKFFIDDTLDEVEHIDNLFNSLNDPNAPIRSMKEAMDARAAREKEALKDVKDELDEEFDDDEEFDKAALLADDEFDELADEDFDGEEE